MKIINTILFLFLFLGILGWADSSWAAPSISSVSGASSAGQSMTVAGSGFGNKIGASPKYWDNMESDAIGVTPAGLSISAGGGGVISDAQTRGTKSLLFSFNTDSVAREEWHRNVFDFGTEGTDKIYLSTWVYIDKTGTTTSSWQWKSIVLGSEPGGYFSPVDGATSLGIQNWWRSSTDSWFNTFAKMYYGDGSFHVGSSIDPNLVSDGYLFNQWQRLEMYVQRSSLPGATDAQFVFSRLGRGSLVSDLAAKSHVSDSARPWRYVGLGQAIASVYDGSVIMKIYYDDLYIDSTKARIELGNASNFNASTHFEVQPASSWMDGSVSVIFNQGSFVDGQTAYVYVIDENGDTNANGYSITIGEVFDITPPSSPSGLSVQ